MKRPDFRCLMALPLLLPAACAGQEGGYPSLAPRPIEQLSLAEPDRPAPPPAIANPEAAARYAPLIAEAKTADGEFRRVLEEERLMLARGRNAEQGSDAWTAAQESLSRIEVARAPVSRILSNLDSARSSDPAHADTGEAIAATQAFEQVSALDHDETETLSAIWPGDR